VKLALIIAGVFGLLAAALLLPSPDLTGSARPVRGGAQPAPAPASSGTGTSDERDLFPPENLVLLEVQDRAIWQQPDLIMDELQMADGSDVADIGAGSGWFTIRLARRVGPNGRVYAQDLQPEMVTAIRRRVEREGLTNVTVIRGQEGSPNLPQQALDAVLVVDVYHEIPAAGRVSFLQDLASALRPKGRIGIVDYKPGAGGPGAEADRRVDSATVERDAGLAELDVLSRKELRYQYLIVLARRDQDAAR
jgi:ubiquinone/menaquinone biosynthesis C-methylase UbiE